MLLELLCHKIGDSIMRLFLVILALTLLGTSVSKADHGSMHDPVLNLKSEKTKPTAPPFRLLQNSDNSAIYVFTDPETLCEYIVYIHTIGGVGITPRIDAETKDHICIIK